MSMYFRRNFELFKQNYLKSKKNDLACNRRQHSFNPKEK
jgi:hypothetical protein